MINSSLFVRTEEYGCEYFTVNAFYTKKSGMLLSFLEEKTNIYVNKNYIMESLDYDFGCNLSLTFNDKEYKPRFLLKEDNDDVFYIFHTTYDRDDFLSFNMLFYNEEDKLYYFTKRTILIPYFMCHNKLIPFKENVKLIDQDIEEQYKYNSNMLTLKLWSDLHFDRLLSLEYIYYDKRCDNDFDINNNYGREYDGYRTY